MSRARAGKMPNKLNQFLHEDKEAQVASVICIDDNRLLILKRSDQQKHRGGAWDLPGGHVDESDNSIEAAAIRELEEESSLKAAVKDLKYVAMEEKSNRNKYYYVTDKFKGTVDIKPNPETGEIEHSSYRWVSVDEVENIDNLNLPNYILRKALKLIQSED